jgi:hypothetical protein
LNAGSYSQTFTATFQLKESHISTISLDFLPGKTDDGFPLAVEAKSISSQSPIMSLRLYSEVNGIDNGYEELLTSNAQNVSRTLYVLPTPVEGDTYTYTLVAECHDGSTKASEPISMRFYRVNYSANGSKWTSIVNDLDFESGDYIETRISLGTSGGNPNKDGLLSIGSDIIKWQATGVYNYHVYYHYDNVGGVSGRCIRTAATSNNVVKSSANKLYSDSEVDMLFNKAGFYIQGSLTTYTTWSNWANLPELQSNLAGSSSLQVGQQEGNNRSYSTYQYVRAVYKHPLP